MCVCVFFTTSKEKISENWLCFLSCLPVFFTITKLVQICTIQNLPFSGSNIRPFPGQAVPVWRPPSSRAVHDVVDFHRPGYHLDYHHDYREVNEIFLECNQPVLRLPFRVLHFPGAVISSATETVSCTTPASVWHDHADFHSTTWNGFDVLFFHVLFTVQWNTIVLVSRPLGIAIARELNLGLASRSSRSENYNTWSTPMTLPVIENGRLAEVAKLAKELLHVLVGDAKVEVVDEQLGRAIAATGRCARSPLPMIEKIGTFRLENTRFWQNHSLYTQKQNHERSNMLLIHIMLPSIIHISSLQAKIKNPKRDFFLTRLE